MIGRKKIIPGHNHGPCEKCQQQEEFLAMAQWEMDKVCKDHDEARAVLSDMSDDLDDFLHPGARQRAVEAAAAAASAPKIVAAAPRRQPKGSGAEALRLAREALHRAVAPQGDHGPEEEK